MKKSYHFYETQTRNIMGKPPPRVLYISSTVMILVLIITGLIAYLVPLNITEKLPATLSYGTVNTSTRDTHLSASSMDTVYQESTSYVEREITVNISADNIRDYIPQIGDTVTLNETNYAYASPIIIDRKIVNSHKVLVACEGSGIVLTPAVVLPEDAVTIRINRGITNYLSYILNI